MKGFFAVVLLVAALASTHAQGSRDMSAQREAADAGAMMGSGGTVTFTTLKEAGGLAAKGPTVLFFNAKWCPLCRADMREIDARMSDLGEITVVIVDYDDAEDLRSKYGVTYQHTYVQIDSLGERIALWNGGGVDGILKNTIVSEDK